MFDMIAKLTDRELGPSNGHPVSVLGEDGRSHYCGGDNTWFTEFKPERTVCGVRTRGKLRRAPDDCPWCQALRDHQEERGTLAERLEKARKQLDLPIRVVADRAHLGLATVGELAAGAFRTSRAGNKIRRAVDPTIGTVAEVAQALSCRPGWLAFGRAELPPAAHLTPDPAQVGERLAWSMKARDKGLRQLARCARVSPTTVSRILSGAVVPSVSTIKRITDRYTGKLEMDATWLSFGTGLVPPELR